MKTLDYFKFWAILCLVCIPVFFGLMCDEIMPALFALAWGAMWWVFFSSTKIGRKVYRKGYRIACSIMGDCDV